MQSSSSFRRILVLVPALGVALAAVALGAGWIWQRTASSRDLAAHPAPGALHRVDGRQMHLHCLGEGSPTVVLVTGLTGPGSVMGPLQRSVAATTRACTYDRAGLGYSDPIDLPRRARETAEDLVALLDAAGIVEPVALVGHSWGGMLARSIAAAHPDRVAGIVLIDASHENEIEAFGLEHAEAPPLPSDSQRPLHTERVRTGRDRRGTCPFPTSTSSAATTCTTTCGMPRRRPESRPRTGRTR